MTLWQQVTADRPRSVVIAAFPARAFSMLTGNPGATKALCQWSSIALRTMKIVRSASGTQWPRPANRLGRRDGAAYRPRVRYDVATVRAQPPVTRGSRATRRRQREAHLSAGASFVDRAPAGAIAGGSAARTRETSMGKQAGFKHRVRAEMAKTDESCATARSRLLAEHPGATPHSAPLDWMPGALHISNGDATDVPGPGSPGA
jgi:hypothetical protein